MKCPLLLGLLLVSTPVFAINTSILYRGDRIGVLRMPERFDRASERAVSSAIEEELPSALHKQGFEAFDTQRTYDEARNGDAPAAAFYVEVVGAHTDGGNNAAGIDVGVNGVYTTVGLLVSHVAAEVRLYDGKTLALIDRWYLGEKNVTVAPTSISLASRFLFAELAMPLVRAGQSRNAAHDVAREAAARIAGAARP